MLAAVGCWTAAVTKIPPLPCVGVVADKSRELFVVGTAHTPCRSAAEVAAVIRAVKPDVVMVELKGIDAYTRERIIEGLPTSSVSPQRKEIFLGKIMQAMRLSAVEGKPVGLDVAAKTLHEADGLEGWMRKAAATLMRMCAKDPVEFRARSKGVGLICIRPDGIPKGGRHAHARVFITTPRVTEPPSHLDIVVHRQ